LFWTALAAERPEDNREASVDAELRGVDCSARHMTFRRVENFYLVAVVKQSHRATVSV
jgi:hypothetical protein